MIKTKTTICLDLTDGVYKRQDFIMKTLVNILHSGLEGFTLYFYFAFYFVLYLCVNSRKNSLYMNELVH